MKKAIFMDRDGTINVDKDYVHKIEDFEFIKGSIDAIKLSNQHDYLVIIVTNQSGIGRGYYTKNDYHTLMEHMCNKVKKNGGTIDEYLCCPHAPEENCYCRKPNKGMIEYAVQRYDIDLKKSWVIGDRTSDIELGHNAGCKTILVKTGSAGKDKKQKVEPTLIVEDVLDAVKKIITYEQH